MVVVANNNKNGATDSDSAYISENSDTTWTQTAKLVASDYAAGDDFWSRSLDLGGSCGRRCELRRRRRVRFGLCVYLREKRYGVGPDRQADRVRRRDRGTPGYAVSISDDTVVVGSNFDDDGGSLSGLAYVFEKSGAAWAQTAKLIPSGDAAGDQFGHRASILGETVVACSRYDSLDLGRRRGDRFVL